MAACQSPAVCLCTALVPARWPCRAPAPHLCVLAACGLGEGSCCPVRAGQRLPFFSLELKPSLLLLMVCSVMLTQYSPYLCNSLNAPAAELGDVRTESSLFAVPSLHGFLKIFHLSGALHFVFFLMCCVS